MGLGLVWAVSAVAATNAPALGDGLVIRSWGTGAGLPQNTVNAIVQTPDGYLWLGTRDGLARFDGVRFTVFGLRDGLQSVEIQTLYVDRQGTLWIGTSGGGLSRWVEGRIENVTLPRQLAAGDTVTALAEDAAGRLWVGTLAGLSVWQDGRFVEMRGVGESRAGRHSGVAPRPERRHVDRHAFTGIIRIPKPPAGGEPGAAGQ